jgi:hypothetical protein
MVGQKNVRSTDLSGLDFMATHLQMSLIIESVLIIGWTVW